MSVASLIKSIYESVERVAIALKRVYQELGIQLPSESASPLSMIYTAVKLIIVGFIVNVILRHISLHRMIDNIYLDLLVFFIGSQVFMICIVVAWAMTFKAIENYFKRP